MDLIKVAFTEQHGMAQELSNFAPPGINYSFLEPVSSYHRFIRSPIKGYLGNFNSENHDIIEAILSPIITENNWIYSTACFQESSAFNFLNIPLPQIIRSSFLKHLMLKDNFKKLIFWSQAGKETLRTYGGIKSSKIDEKTTVVYPSIREVPDSLVHKCSDTDITLLFSGAFFLKGGVNVIDAFELVQKNHPNVKLILCCDEKIDFVTPNNTLKYEYLTKVKSNKSIDFCGRVPRNHLITNILPKIDIYLLPTYYEAFGFSILEAMAYGIPVISTNYFAIPEMIEHNKSGLLINTSGFNCEKTFHGYRVNHIPKQFRDHITESLYNYICQLVESKELRIQMGIAALKTARSKFSFAVRNQKMVEIYREALQK